MKDETSDDAYSVGTVAAYGRFRIINLQPTKYHFLTLPGIASTVWAVQGVRTQHVAFKMFAQNLAWQYFDRTDVHHNDMRLDKRTIFGNDLVECSVWDRKNNQITLR
jgi:hypothetical protein